MAAVTFDTHTFAKELTDAGMPERQAEVLARTMMAAIGVVATFVKPL